MKTLQHKSSQAGQDGLSSHVPKLGANHMPIGAYVPMYGTHFMNSGAGIIAQDIAAATYGRNPQVTNRGTLGRNSSCMYAEFIMVHREWQE
eukprot:12672146-Ditylum_brightwellii.AAC.1